MPLGRCVDHLLHLVVRVVEANTSRGENGEADLEVSTDEAHKFAQARAKLSVRNGVRMSTLSYPSDYLHLKHVHVFAVSIAT